jgi:hypothetical protein
LVSERDRERLFWKISLLFLLASPLTVYQLARAHYFFVFNPIPFTIILFLSIPLSLVVDAVLIKLFDPTSPLRFWIVKPTDEVQHLLQLPVQEGEAFKEMIERTHLKMIAGRIKERLAGFGFQTTKEEDVANSIVIAFHKEKSRPVISFTDHSMFGEVRIGFLGSAVKVNVQTTFNDTLLLESGEFERIRALCDYLSLKTATFSYSSVPLTVYCGVNLAFTMSFFAIVPYVYPGNLVITCLSTGAAGMLVAALVLMQKNRDQVLGYRLVFAGLFLASLPLVSQLSELFRN